MKIKTHVGLTLGGMIFLLSLIAIGGYSAANIVRLAGNAIPTILVPGIQDYNDMRYKSLDAAMSVYQNDQQKLVAYFEELNPRLDVFSVIPEDSPFLGDPILEKNLPLLAETMRAVVTEGMKHDFDPSSTPSANFIAAVENLQRIGPTADEVIQHLIELTNQEVDSVIRTVVNLLTIVSVLVVLIGIGSGWLLTRKLNHGISSLQKSFRQISLGDLKAIADDSNDDELGELAGYFNELAGNLKSTVGQLAGTMQTLSDLSERFRTSGQEHQDRAQQTSIETHMVATAMTEMTATVREVATNANMTSKKALEASSQTGTAKTLIDSTKTKSQQLLGKMTSISNQVIELKDQTSSISIVLEEIRGIAEQTNLLALNAAIEAARAGDQGRGFAVVADEVRNLATRTGQSTEEISSVISKLQVLTVDTADQIELGKAGVEENAESISNIEIGLLKILNNIESISDMNQQIASSAQEQSEVAEEMNSNIVKINDLTDQSAGQTKVVNDDINTIDELTREVQNLIRHFSY